ncbi:hypothetical protein WP50_30815, partial [Lactiplantibacillus plantarum]
MKPRVLTTLLVCSAILTTTVTPAVAAVTPMATPSEQVAEPVASPAVPTATLSLAVQNQQLVDLIGQTQWQTYGQPAVTKDPEFNDQVLNLDGKSAFYTTFTDQQFAKLQNGMAIEAYFKYDPAADANGEHEIFSSQQGGGLGLGVQNNQVVFFAHDGSGYKTPKGTLHKGQWVHAVGVIDKNKTASLYLDGQLVQQVAMPGDLKLAQGTKDFVLGGDAVPGSHVQSMMTGQIRQARLYDQTLTSQQVSQLNVEAQVGKQPVAPVPVDQTIATKLVGPKRIASGHIYGLNVHARKIKATGAAPITMDVVYDAAKFDYVGAERLLQGGKTQIQLGQPAVTKDPEFNDQVLNLDGKSAFYTTFTDQQFAKLQNGMAIEAYFKYDPAADANGEHEIFSSQQGGGLGLGVQNNQVVFFAHDGSGYKTPKGTLHKGQWVHAVGVIDKNKTASLYLDGQLVQQVAMPVDLKLAKVTKYFVQAGDAIPGPHLSPMLTDEYKQPRLYDQTLTSQQVSQLNVEAQVGKQPVAPVPVDQTIATKLVGPKRIASGHIYGLNVHARKIKATGAAPITMDVVYDAAKFDYVGAERLLQGGKTQIQLIAPGRIRLTTTANLSKAEFKMYAQTRLAHLNLKAKAAGETQIKFEQLTKDTTIELGPAQTVEIQGKYALDYNGDGIIGVGDVALANAADKVAAAKAAEIKPYKHVVVLTTDGGGNPWDPKGMYYAQGAEQGTKTPVWTTNPEIMKKRRNTYTMDLFNKQFAMSTSARAVSPAISAQNYISMLHGRPWDTLPKEYQGTNATMGQEYFADFNKPQAMFPSVFKMLQADNPTRGAAAFSEWGPIVNSIIEPDAAVTTKQSASLKSFDDVANYIGTPEFQSTGLVYMQSDYMDGQGHGHGWYNDNYWD